MEALAEALQPYEGIIGWIGAAATAAHYFAGSIVCKNIIYNGKSTENISPVLFVGGIIL